MAESVTFAYIEDTSKADEALKDVPKETRDEILKEVKKYKGKNALSIAVTSHDDEENTYSFSISEQV